MRWRRSSASEAALHSDASPIHTGTIWLSDGISGSPAPASASEAGTPLPIILLAILGGLLLVIGLVVWFARFMGWGLDRWAPALQTWREAVYRSENAISEFADWARRGR